MKKNMFRRVWTLLFFMAIAGGSILTGGGLLLGSEGARRKGDAMGDSGKNEKATFGGGCFWCIEAVYERVEGVKSVVSGYAGGEVQNPTYEQVSTGTTGHAEVVQVEYDPQKISYAEILDLFWKAHDPTTLNRQGADAGTQYRSIILYHDEAQKTAAQNSMKALAASKTYKGRVVTEIKPLTVFYPAEEYHQDYYDRNPYAGYCAVVISPKLKKLGLPLKFN
jgi:peptide-methionine (S)-S-oxide reductase